MTAAIEASLAPNQRIVGEDTRWTLAERMENYCLPGVSIAVARAGAVDWARGYGVVEAGGNRAVTPATLFQAASMSKPLAAFLVMQQVEAGRLELDRDVNDWLRSWQVPANAYTAERPVTLRRLLSHTAGLTVHGFEGFRPGEPIPTLPQILRGEPPATTEPVVVDILPGTEQRYSGGGTTVAQLVLEEVTGKPFAELAAEQLLAPLGLTRSTFAQPLPVPLQADAARGHRANRAVLQGGWRILPQLAAGGLWTTASDYARFFLEVRNAWLGRSPLLGRELAAEMLTPQPGGFFALGPMVKGAGASRRFEHGGSNQGFKCEALLYLESGDGAVVLTNGDLGTPFCWEVFNAAAALHDWPGYLPPPKTPLQLEPALLARYSGEYRAVAGLPEGHRFVVRFEDGRLISYMDGQPPAEMLAQSATEFFSRNTPFVARFTLSDRGLPTGFRVFDGDTEIIAAKYIGSEGAGTPPG